MKKVVPFFISFLLCCIRLQANPGDTVVVQTFTFGSPQNAWFVFPDDTMRTEKVYMKYTLKCNPAQNPACGEWDYLTYTYLYDHTGLTDSNLLVQPTTLVNGNVADSISYINSPSYSYFPTWQNYINHTDTISLNAYTFGNQSSAGNAPFGASQPVSRSQYLWKASELTTAGMSAGAITGLRFYAFTTGSPLEHLSIRIKASTLDSLQVTDIGNTSGFVQVYEQNTTLTSGWNNLQLTTPFNWDGTSNLIIEITYDNIQAGTSNMTAIENTPFVSGLVNSGNDRMLSLHQFGYVTVPVNNAVAALDSFVTVSLWCYGDQDLQPMDGTAFEAVNDDGNRILNAHLPWGNGNVYWDAGYSGTSYDRINQLAAAADYKGKWNNWVFTKNVANGTMKVYVNGVLWHSGTGKTKPLNGISAFRIGKGNWGGSQTYEGNLDEITVFNKELSQATIQAYANRSVDASHPDYGNLILYYRFNDGNYLNFTDIAPSGNPPAINVSGANPLKKSSDLVFDFTTTQSRPDIVFEQGVFTSVSDSVLVVDSIMNAPVQVLLYNDSVNNPGVPTDTLTVWPTYYNHYLFDSTGTAIDSLPVMPDSTIYGGTYDYYEYFPQVIRYELARYITPYGNGLSLGNGWTWTFDVSDYRKLLSDSVHLEAGNWQELLDLKFLFIKGTPPRDVLSVQNLWNGGFNYGDAGNPIDNYLPAKTLNLPASAVNSRWKSRITGHGMDTPENCAEFCPKMHYFKVNGLQQYSKLVWRDNCDRNPLYPQGGTWVYDRSNWCPGAEVWTYDFELTPYATPGSALTLDHDVQPYTATGGWHYYQIEDQLVTYGAPNFTLDACIEDIISPSTDQMHLRMNPVCTNAFIKIKNTGSTPLTSLKITYGLNGATASVLNWTGNLAFLDTAVIRLGAFNWAQGASKFTVTLSDPNGGVDQYAPNNTKVSDFIYPTLMPAQFIVEYKTNNYPTENSYTIRNASGSIVASRDGSFLTANTVYRDTLTLADGCYTFEMTDNGEDGLQWWANTAQGSGYIRFKKISPSTIITSFGNDFGGQIYRQFTVGLSSETKDFIWNDQPVLQAYPNPASHQVTIDVNFSKSTNGVLEIVNTLGERLYRQNFENVISDSFQSDLSNAAPGLYFVRVYFGNETRNIKLLIGR